MAQFSTFKAIAFFVAVVMYFATANAQEFGTAPAPAPVSAAYTSAMSGAVICSSLFLSLLFFLKN